MCVAQRAHRTFSAGDEHCTNPRDGLATLSEQNTFAHPLLNTSSPRRMIQPCFGAPGHSPGLCISFPSISQCSERVAKERTGLLVFDRTMNSRYYSISFHCFRRSMSCYRDRIRCRSTRFQHHARTRCYLATAASTTARAYVAATDKRSKSGGDIIHRAEH